MARQHCLEIIAAWIPPPAAAPPNRHRVNTPYSTDTPTNARDYCSCNVHVWVHSTVEIPILWLPFRDSKNGSKLDCHFRARTSY